MEVQMDFNEQISKKWVKYGSFGRCGFIKVINHVLLLHKGSITKFYLHIPNTHLESFQDVDLWMLFLSTEGVKDLTLANSNRRYQLPFCVFSFFELRKLELNNCIFKPPLHFDGFLYLEFLILNSIDFTTNLSGNVVNLPQLENLTMRSCTNVYNLKIKATNLRLLVVENCPDVMLLELLHSQHLGHVFLTFEKSIKDLLRIERMNLAFMFGSMPKVHYFTTDGHFIKAFIAEKPKWFPHTVSHLKHLKLCNMSLGDLDHLHGVLCLLQNSPNLETLSLTRLQTESELKQHEVETTSNHLDSPDCLDQTLNRLKTVELSPLQISRPQLLFIKLLLAHSPSLLSFPSVHMEI